MKNCICVKCPAKINLTLEIINKRDDGFHNIKSIMQLISLYDFLTISIEKSDENRIVLAGNSNEIPYNEKNLVYKAADLFFKKIGIVNYKADIYIEKNIPISAGLAGGSTNAAGTLFGLNTLFDKPLSESDLNQLCASIGSDLNVCLKGGCVLATSRGEVTQKLNNIESKVTLIKPKNLGISAKEAYTKYSNLTLKPKYNMTEKMIEAINCGNDISKFLYNDLESAVINDYKELQYIKNVLPNSIMSGSGSTYFLLGEASDIEFPSEYSVIKNLNFIHDGVSINS